MERISVYKGKIIDFHLHIGRKEDWLLWVMEYLKKMNPYLFQNFKKIMNTDGLEEYLDKEGVTKY